MCCFFLSKNSIMCCLIPKKNKKCTLSHEDYSTEGITAISETTSASYAKDKPTTALFSA